MVLGKGEIKNEALNFLKASKVQFLGGKSLIDGFNHSIAQKNGFVNTDFSFSDNTTGACALTSAVYGAYSLKYIEKVVEFDSGVHLDNESLTESHSTTTYSIAGLFELVKNYDI